MPDATATQRRGTIDSAGDLTAFDVLAFNDGVNPFGNPFVEHGFELDTAEMRATVAKWGIDGFNRVADLGSGFGAWGIFLAEVNAAVIGYERNAGAVELSRRLASRFDLDNAKFKVGDVAALPCPDESFDAAWCQGVLHIVDRAEALTEAHRILRPGAILHVGVYNGVGRVLEKLVAGYREGGADHRTTRFALRILKQGSLFDSGKGNFADPDTIWTVMARFGFAPDPDRTIEIEGSRAARGSGAAFADLADLPRFVERFENDPAYADAIVANPAITVALPRNLAFNAIRT